MVVTPKWLDSSLLACAPHARAWPRRMRRWMFDSKSQPRLVLTVTRQKSVGAYHRLAPGLSNGASWRALTCASRPSMWVSPMTASSSTTEERGPGWRSGADDLDF